MRTRILAYGFRPHFLLAGVSALALVIVWALNQVFAIPLGTAWPPLLWHAHEMLFGFITCAIGGFLLTAVPSWTGQKGYAGAPLAVLSLVWLLARLLAASSRWWPPVLVALIDLAYLPLLAGLVAAPLIRERNRNTPFLLILAVLWLCNVVFHWALLRQDAQLAYRALLLGIDIVLVLVTVVGGRIVPAFTSSGLRQAGVVVSNNPLLGRVAIAGMILVLVSDLLWPQQTASGIIAAVVALVQLLRLAQWRSLRTLRHPIIWILHLAYAWLPLGLALKAVTLLTHYSFGAFWLHALTVGALTTMIVAVMTRASLGHTGRPLVVSPWTTTAYVLLTVAAIVRVFGAALGFDHRTQIAGSAIVWSGAFLLYLFVYAPILWGPRADGKPG
ncbi:MAG: NnrS family protein [Steroidobacteraceae bacterium]